MKNESLRNDCQIFMEQISLYIDDELNALQKEEFEKHITSCDDCKKEYNHINQLVQDLSQLEKIELPEDFHADFMKKISNTNHTKKSSFGIKSVTGFGSKSIAIDFRKYASFAASFVLMCILLSGTLRLFVNPDAPNYTQESPSMQSDDADWFFSTGSDLAEISTAKESDSYTEIFDMVEGTGSNIMMEPSDIIQESSVPPVSARSMPIHDDLNLNATETSIKNYTLYIEADDYDAAIDVVDSLKPYVVNNTSYDNSEVSSMEVVLKPPTSEYYNVISQIKAIGKIENEYEGERIVSFDILDANSSLTAKQKEYDNLMTLLSQSNTVEDMLKVDNRLNQVGSEIEGIKLNLNNLENESGYPIIAVSITEKPKPVATDESDETFLAKIKSNLIGSANTTTSFFENFAITAATWIVPLTIAIAVIVTIYLSYRVRRRRNEQ